MLTINRVQWGRDATFLKQSGVTILSVGFEEMRLLGQLQTVINFTQGPFETDGFLQSSH
jgi:hypothetical protein